MRCEPASCLCIRAQRDRSTTRYICQLTRQRGSHSLRARLLLPPSLPHACNELRRQPRPRRFEAREAAASAVPSNSPRGCASSRDAGRKATLERNSGRHRSGRPVCSYLEDRHRRADRWRHRRLRLGRHERCPSAMSRPPPWRTWPTGLARVRLRALTTKLLRHAPRWGRTPLSRTAGGGAGGISHQPSPRELVTVACEHALRVQPKQCTSTC